MKTAFQLAVSAGALAGLLAAAASHATPLSELPLKASVLAKPNLVFAMDDSGSMDWEILLSTNQGMAWWNGSSSFDSTTKKPISSSNYYPYVYLFPIGTDPGGAIYGSGTVSGQAAPPTAQFAWLRAAKFNPIYYNSNVTYEPWAQATVDGVKKTYPQASAASALSHPEYAAASDPRLALNAQWAAGGNFTVNNYRFMVQAGMKLPVGTVVNSSSDTASGVACTGTQKTLTAVQTVASGRSCQASIPYYPATFWAPDTSSTPCTANDVDCVASPDGKGMLKRYEIKSGNTFPSGRPYQGTAATATSPAVIGELENFANWFTYNRKRKLMLAASMGKSLENVTGLRMAVMGFSENPTLAMRDADATDNTLNRYVVSGRFYKNGMSPNSTPTHATMKRIGEQFNSNTSIVEYACQRNSMFVVTDGFANAHSETAPAYNAATWGTGPPYETTPVNSMAHFALAYYTNPLREKGDKPLVKGMVPPGNPARPNADKNPDLHITTYAITLGTRGTLNPDAADPFPIDVIANPPTWPALVAENPTMIDDLWHATVNGRGRMYLASDVQATTLAIQSALDDIAATPGAQGGVSVSSVNLGSTGDPYAYLGKYNPSGWIGDLTKNKIDTKTATVSGDQVWSAHVELTKRPWADRKIFSSSATAGVVFDATNVGAAVAAGSGFAAQDTVDYLRGNATGEGTLYRKRSTTIDTVQYAGLMRAVVNAEPVLARDDTVVYQTSGEGMLHAFDMDNGSELWAYAPPSALADMGRSMKRGWVYKTLLDATPVVAKLAGGGKLLVTGMGAAGRSYHALTVSSPRPATREDAAKQFRWTFPAASGPAANIANVGYTVGKPVIARIKVGGAVKDVVLVTSGYDNGQGIGDKRGRLWVLNASDGTVLKSFITPSVTGAQETGLAHVAAFKESDGTALYAYGGDLLGNLWQFDLSASGTDISAKRIAILKDASGNLQPVTTVPELAKRGDKRVVLVGTGRLLDVGDFGGSSVQSFYAIADGAELAEARKELVAQVFSGSGSGSITNNAMSWSTHRGWYFDLPAGQHANTDPAIVYGAIAFVTNVNGSSDCSQSSFIYYLNIGNYANTTGDDVRGGTAVAGGTFVGTTMFATENSSRVLPVNGANGGGVFGLTQSSSGKPGKTPFEKPKGIKPQKNAWREIRR